MASDVIAQRLVHLSPSTGLSLLLLSGGVWVSVANPKWGFRGVSEACGVAALLVAGWVIAGDDRSGASVALRGHAMSPATVVSALALGMALTLRQLRIVRLRPAEWLLAVPILMFVSTLMSSLYRLHPPQPLLDSVLFAGLAVTALLAWASKRARSVFTRRDASGILARRMLPAALLAPMVLGWARLEGQRYGLYGTEFGLELMVVGTSTVIGVVAWITIARLEVSETLRLAATVAERGEAERLRLAVGAGHVGLWEWDLATNTVQYSEEWKRQIGYADHEIGADFNEWQSRVHPEDLAKTLALIDDYMQRDAPGYESQFRFRHKDGSYRRILAQATEVRDASGVRVKLVGSHVDVTDFAALQEQVAQLYRVESLGRLAGGIAHDFNNLLTVINGAAELLLEDLPKGSQFSADALAIREAGSRAAALTAQLLAFSRQQLVTPTVLSPAEVFATLEGMLRRLLHENIELTIVVAPDNGHVTIDRAQLEQVVINLAVNAQDAMPSGGRLAIDVRNVTLDAAYCAAHQYVSPGAYVRLTFSDSGDGMDAGTRARIFEPFFTTKGPGKGTGLGLAMVYGAVKQSGGNIEVDSEPGRGTTFTINLPRTTQAARAIAPSTLTAMAGHERILVVEDEPELRRMIVQMLGASGYAVVAAGSGGEAVSLLASAERPFDLMLTDVVMPGMSAADLIASVSVTHPSMAVILISGYADDYEVVKAVREGQVPFLSKPFSRAELGRKVREVLDRPRR